jgi:hypothetical protein
MFRFDRDELEEDSRGADGRLVLVNADSTTNLSLRFGCSLRLGKESRVTISGACSEFSFAFIIQVGERHSAYGIL